ncbi:MAG: hypothetical protein WC538_19500 [Thermoanaerobaculia bacterium]|jgi:hypothetical protein
MHLARSVFALVVFSVSNLRAAEPAVAYALPEPPTGRFEVSLVETVKEHSQSTKISDVCRVGFRVRGCTDFPREELACHCEQREGSWFLTGRANIEAVIHLSSGQPMSQVLLHERAHIGDLKKGLREHFDAIMSIRFGMQSACETYAHTLVESPHLRVVMNDLRIASNVKYGCDRKGKF